MRLLVACVLETDLGDDLWHRVIFGVLEHQSDRNADNVFVADDEAHLVVLQDVSILVAKDAFEAFVEGVEDELHVGQQHLAHDVAVDGAVVHVEGR